MRHVSISSPRIRPGFVALAACRRIAEGDRFVAHLDLRLAVIDRHGHRSEVPHVAVRLVGDRPPDTGTRGLYPHTILTRKGEQELVLVLSDPLSGTLFSARVELDP